MVISEGNNNTKLTFTMGTTTTSTSSSSKKPPLHNFAMPPFLSWGTHKLLRCKKVDSDPTAENLSIGRHRNDDDGGFEAVREKLMLDLQTEADKMKVSILGEMTALDGGRPWNLRTRRAACRAPKGGTFNGGDVKKSNFFSPLLKTDDGKSSRLYGESYDASEKKERRKREKFSVSLSRGEIEEDFMVMARHKPHRRPKKRPKVVQKQLDSLFPGLWLTEVTADMYKVADAP